MPPKRDKQGRRIKKATCQRVRQNQEKPQKVRTEPPASPAASPAKRTRGCRAAAVAARAAIVDRAPEQDQQEEIGLADAIADAGIASEERAHTSWGYFWAKALDAPMEDAELRDAAKQIQVAFREPPGSIGSIQAVLQDVRECVLEHREYTGQRQRRPRDAAKLAMDGAEASIIADCIEDGISLRQTLAEVNAWRIEAGLEHVGPRMALTFNHSRLTAF